MSVVYCLGSLCVGKCLFMSPLPFLQFFLLEEQGPSLERPVSRSPEVSSGNEVGSLNPTLLPLNRGLPGESTLQAFGS